MGQNAVNNKQYISQFWFLKLTKRYKFKFCFCLKLRYKAFLTILVNIYHIFFLHGDLQWAHWPGHSFVRFVPGEELSYINPTDIALK